MLAGVKDALFPHGAQCVKSAFDLKFFHRAWIIPWDAERNEWRNDGALEEECLEEEDILGLIRGDEREGE